MGLISANFNRIIDVSLIPEKGNPKTIICPRHGRKPAIEISGDFWANMTLPEFNLTIKNLNLDLQKDQYTRIKVNCGYEGNTVPIEGTILSIYPESPGPESNTVIQCQLGNMKDWLDATVDMNYMAETKLMDVLNAIKTKLNITQVFMGEKARALTLNVPFMHSGSAREALGKLSKDLEEHRLALFMRDMTLCAVCLTEGDFVGTQVMQYMSAPPQMNIGSEKGTYYTTVTGPWMPKLRIGDLLEIPSRIYMHKFQTVGNGKTQRIQVTNIKFHFGTTKGMNSMTVRGFIV